MTTKQHGLIKFVLILIIAVVAVGGYLVYKRSGKIDLSFIEKKPPVIQAIAEPIGVGAEVKHLPVTLSDDGAGLDEVVVRIEQNGHSIDLLKKDYPPNSHTDELVIDIPAKEKGLKEGDATLKISAFDKSFWSNSSSNAFTVRIAYTKPKVEVLTAQHNVAIGGVELAFYRVKGRDIKRSGVLVGDKLYEGSQALKLNPAFEKYPDIYFSFFALPYNFNKDKEKISVVVEDSIGNRGSSSLYYLIIPRKYKDAEMKLSEPFLRKVFDELLPPYYASLNQSEPSFTFENLTPEEKAAKFKLINEDYRVLLLKKMEEIFKQSEDKQLWTAPWNRPMSAAPTSTFAETRTYTLDGKYASTSLHAGVDLADVANAVVHAANSGKVLFADFLGIYGNAVIIDHGFGLTTLYGHLSSIAVNVGDEVQKDTPIGRSGATGLAGGDHLHFEIRLRGTPVHPIEWWDALWIREHVEKKIHSVIDQTTAQANLDAQISQ